MLSLIHDWLELARIERGTLCEPGAASDLDEVIAQVIEAAGPQAQAAGSPSAPRPWPPARRGARRPGQPRHHARRTW